MGDFTAISRHYETLKRIGHTRPTSAFGAPALVWHLALWPDRNHDPNNVRDELEIEELVDSLNPEPKKRWLAARVRPVPVKIGPVASEVLDSFHRKAVNNFFDRSLLLQEGVNALLLDLQKSGRYGSSLTEFDRFVRIDPERPRERFEALTDPKKRLADGSAQFGAIKPESVSFTLWWPDKGLLNRAQPDRDALRVRVHAEMHMDFWTLSFYIDVRRLWRKRPQTGSSAVPADVPMSAGNPNGTRREKILHHIWNIEAHCGAAVLGASVEADLLPEQIGKGAADELSQAGRYLYETIWTEFCRDFGLGTLGNEADPSRIAGDHSRVFGNFRGLVMSTKGVDRKEQGVEGDEAAGIGEAHAGRRPFSRFQHNDGSEAAQAGSTNEANAVVKAYFPFVRRITPELDSRDIIACGLMGWRALYITALGSLATHDIHDEIEDQALDVPHDALPEQEPGHRETGVEPIRFLLLTKGEPHRRQIGRLVERINAMGTMRFYALKDWNVLRNASVHIRMRGQELDQIIRAWGVGRAHIDMKTGQDFDKRDAWIGQYTRYIEGRLLSIGAALDKIGSNAVGGIHYRINRSRYYVKEFRILLETLGIGNMDTWISYKNFVDRGLTPAFDFIDNLGTRLEGLRTRLQAVTDGIQTSALVAQANATRENTTELRLIAQAARWVSTVGGFGAILGAIRYGLQIAEITTPAGHDPAILKLIAAGAIVTICAIMGYILWPRRPQKS